jgi:hypothetical protein
MYFIFLCSRNKRNGQAVLDKITAFKDFYMQIPGTCEPVTLHGKKVFLDVIKLMILR